VLARKHSMNAVWACVGSQSRRVETPFSSTSSRNEQRSATRMPRSRSFCTSERVGDGPCMLRDELTSVPETYKAFPDQQSVIVWIGHDAPSKLSNCAVRDALNWRCTRNDKKVGTVDQSMANGQLTETVDGNPSPGLGLFYQAPRLRWWLVKLLETSGLRK